MATTTVVWLLRSLKFFYSPSDFSSRPQTSRRPSNFTALLKFLHVPSNITAAVRGVDDTDTPPIFYAPSCGPDGTHYVTSNVGLSQQQEKLVPRRTPHRRGWQQQQQRLP